MPERTLSADDVRHLYDRHGPALLAYACSFVVDVAAGEDVLHQVFLRLLQKNTPVPDVPLAYLYRSVRNAALNARRDGQRELAHDFAASEHGVLFEHRDGGNREAALALQSALFALPEEQREVVVLRIWSGMTFDEVAALTGVPLNTAASRYRYALETLREQLKPYVKQKP